MSRNSTELLIDLSSAQIGGNVLAASDELLGPKEGLLTSSQAGWETRRRHAKGHDWAIVALGVPGVIRHVVVDTTGFVGRQPAQISVESIRLPGSPDIVELVRDPGRWAEIVPRSSPAIDRVETFVVGSAHAATHIRLVMYPDGGIAGLRVLGDPTPREGLLDGEAEIDLAAVGNGARVIDCSGPSFSSPNEMLGNDGRWLTHRRRDTGHEWAMIRLAGRGSLDRLEVDTTDLIGDAPESIAVDGVDALGANLKTLRKVDWTPLLASTVTEVGSIATYPDLEPIGVVTHVRLNLHPDGGITRFKAFGVSEEPWMLPS